uniref:Uncharacterized protein n=1 Tax=Anguilla anguilla TaxID=7936 RepID=A0A0E9Q0K8_ANGAN
MFYISFCSIHKTGSEDKLPSTLTQTEVDT